MIRAMLSLDEKVTKLCCSHWTSNLDHRSGFYCASGLRSGRLEEPVGSLEVNGNECAPPIVTAGMSIRRRDSLWRHSTLERGRGRRNGSCRRWRSWLLSWDRRGG